MSSHPKSVQDALHETAAFPGNINPANGKWEAVDGNRKKRTRLVFHPETGKLIAEEAAKVYEACKTDQFLGIDMAKEGFFQSMCCFIMSF